MALSATCNNPPTGHVGEAYDHFLGIAGIPDGQTVTWAITSGSLPPGLSLNASTGEISGIPTQGGRYPFSVGITVNRAAVASATLHVTTSESGSLASPAFQLSLVSAKGVVSAERTLINLRNDLGTSPTDSVFHYLWDKSTANVGVMAGDPRITLYPELAFNPSAPNLIYPITIYQLWGQFFSPNGVADLHVYGASLDVTRSDGATGTLSPKGFNIIYGSGIDSTSTTDYVTDPGNAIDGDPDTFATIHRSHLGVDIFYPVLEIGTSGWVDLGDEADLNCSITIIGPGGWLDLWVWRQLFAVESTDQELTFPPGYERAMLLQLASEFGRQYPGHDLRKLKLKLAKAIEHIDRENVTNGQAVEELPQEPPQ